MMEDVVVITLCNNMIKYHICIHFASNTFQLIKKKINDSKT